MASDATPAQPPFSPLRFIGYTLVAGLIGGVAVWAIFKLSPDLWRLARAPVSWFALSIAPLTIGFLVVQRQPPAERGWTSLLWAWIACLLFTLGMNLPSITNLRVLLAILVFVLPAATIGVAAALLMKRRERAAPGDAA
ncbi:MAG TPA: hypothetical protein VLF18_22880 [Tahibacter sp.]|uniref:hypothetical protein n=1 Tax=Tahibacter sp. TaxID=2056211 RepID=UPI002C01FF6E|nr:hypothetical protein [Tahibacter sp.]HSX63042.1 hypothetical protein [Tahibacter sp.]